MWTWVKWIYDKCWFMAELLLKLFLSVDTFIWSWVVVCFSKPMMDLLVTLCAKYHLNPSGHTIELITTNRNHVKFKPNALIGALEAEKILLKPKGLEDRSKKTGSQMPEVQLHRFKELLHLKINQTTFVQYSSKSINNQFILQKIN